MLFLIFSCGNNDIASCSISDLDDNVANEINTLNTTGTLFANDPTTANCNAWKNAANAYLNAIENFDSSCDGITAAQYDQVVQGAKTVFDAILCN